MSQFIGSLLVPLAVLAAAIVMMIVEATRPGRSWPKVSGWYARALAANAVQAGVVVASGFLWDGWLRAHRLWNADWMGVTWGAVLGYVVSTFVYYWWHRFRHDSPFLWRWFHQVHHSPSRIEVITSFYKHPFELLANGVISSVTLYTVCGVGPQAAGYAMLLSGLAELFYHWNVRTPRWVGYVFQRPEMHCIHHKLDFHACNYGDLPIWDILFGTFANPAEFRTQCGFGGNQELRIGEMLIGRDINAPEAMAPSATAAKQEGAQG